MNVNSYVSPDALISARLSRLRSVHQLHVCRVTPLSWATLHMWVTYRNESQVGMSHATQMNEAHVTPQYEWNTHECAYWYMSHAASYFIFREWEFFCFKEFAPTTPLTRLYAHTDTCDTTLKCEAWLIHMWYDQIMCATWLLHVCDMTYSCAQQDSDVSVTYWPFEK